MVGSMKSGSKTVGSSSSGSRKRRELFVQDAG